MSKDGHFFKSNRNKVAVVCLVYFQQALMDSPPFKKRTVLDQQMVKLELTSL